jgi:hypothetical protein
LLAGGTMVEDIMDYNRVHNMFSQLTSTNTRQNEDIEAFGINGGDRNNAATTNFPGIDPASRKTVCTKL